MADACTSKPVSVAYYVTGHGLGHATRVAEVCKQLLGGGHIVHVVSGAPEWVFRLDVSPPHQKNLLYRKVVLDYGAKQVDAVSVDRVGSLEEYFRTSVEPRDALLAAESAWMKQAGVHVVVSDIVPLACAAAELAGVPSVCVTNFSWDFVYAEYLTAAGTHPAHLQNIVWQIAEDYAKARLLLRLPGHTPMPAFREVVDVPLVTRRARRSREQIRAEIGVPMDCKLVLYQFGGQDAQWTLDAASLPIGWMCVLASHTLSERALPQKFVRAPIDAYIPDLVGAADCVLGKIGYGTASESLAHNVPLVYVRRSYFNEEPFLRKLLELNDCAVEMARRDFFGGHWQPYLERALQLSPNYKGTLDGGQRVAETVVDVARARYQGAGHCGQVRLRDAIVFGYHLMRSSSFSVDAMEAVPSWYTQGQAPLATERRGSAAASSLVDQVEIKHGSTCGLKDTETFLHTLVSLQTSGLQDTCHERRAAAGLFRWDEDIVVTRAPGRLDVMGGIADYSGSLVLEMPIREACHVALQRQAPDSQPAWKHTRERHKRHGPGLVPTLRIVSFGGEETDRAPAFDMDLTDFFDKTTGEPITYEAAKAFFKQDVARNWAAYVAGTVLVLMRERGVRFEDGISVLVHSEVPEGKGVSSSAAVEVASMTALAAAFQVHVQPEDLAVLCQMVENLVVGAPCGVMDQMTSVCGQEGKLLALMCRPAQIIGHVTIPSHVQFWGIDSGIRHSVGGSDYGSVRVGAFMGKRLIAACAVEGMRADPPLVSSSSPVTHAPSTASSSVSKSEPTEAPLPPSHAAFYLAAVPPHEYQRAYERQLPASYQGRDFVDKVGDHADPVTTIDLQSTYEVRTCTGHPVFENFRTEMFKELMKGPGSKDQLRMLGQLMYQSHVSYSQCGLGSPGTDRLVALVEQAPVSGELYGAKITGGGSGGTVCILGSRSASAESSVLSVVAEYKKATSHQPYVFRGSSPGAAQFGHLIIRVSSSG